MWVCESVSASMHVANTGAFCVYTGTHFGCECFASRFRNETVTTTTNSTKANRTISFCFIRFFSSLQIASKCRYYAFIPKEFGVFSLQALMYIILYSKQINCSFKYCNSTSMFAAAKWLESQQHQNCRAPIFNS